MSSSIQITNSDNVIYPLSTISDALKPSNLNGVMQLRTDRVIRVEATQWRECLAEINEACAYSWRIINPNNQPRGLTCDEAKSRHISLSFSLQYCCHRADKYKSVAKDRPIQKRSKKVDCKCTLRIRSYYAHPEYYEFCIEKVHTNHVPAAFKRSCA